MEYAHYTSRYKLRMMEDAIAQRLDPLTLLLVILFIIDPVAVRANLQHIKQNLHKLDGFISSASCEPRSR